jgi:hypothetical protein
LLLTVLLSGCWWEDGSAGTRTGNNSSEKTITPANVASAHQVWSASFATSFIGKPYTDGANVYVHDVNTVRAFDEQTGAMKWQDPLPNDVTGQLTIADGRLLVPLKPSSDNTLVVAELDPGTGSLITDDIFPFGTQLAGSIATDSKTSAIALTASDGSSQIWYGSPASATAPTFTHEAVVPTPTVTAPAIADGAIVVGGFNKAFAVKVSTDPATCVPDSPCSPFAISPAFTAADGSVPAGGLFTDYPVVTHGRVGTTSVGRAVLATVDGRMLVFDYPSLASAGELDSTTGLPLTASAISGDRLVTQTSDGRVYAFDLNGCVINAQALTSPCVPGALLQTTAPKPIDPAVQPEVAGQVVYAYSLNGTISTWDLECQPAGEGVVFPFCKSIATLPVSSIRGASVSEGTIFVTTGGGITALRTDT